MIIGTIELDPEDPSKQIKITDDIGFNPSRRNIIRNQNFNMNLMTEKNTKEDIDRLTYQYFDLSDNKNEEIKNKFSEENLNNTKSSKITNNFTGFLYPEIKNEDKNNNIAFDGGTFITDKISFSPKNEKGELKINVNNIKNLNDDINKNDINKNDNSNINNINNPKNAKNRGEIYSTGFESIEELNHSIPISFDKLIVNLSDKSNNPKPINPLFFIINGEKPKNKTKVINFRTNPSLYTTFMNKRRNHTNDNINKKSTNLSKNKKNQKELEDLNKLKNKIINKSLNLSNKSKFITSFNKVAEDKPKLNYDVKKTIFNNPFTHMEDKYKILKDLQRNELMNRALGRGIFSCNKYFDDEKKALSIQRRKEFETFFEDSKEKLVINLRTKYDFFDRKKSLPDSQNIITQDYLKFAKEDYKQTQIYKHLDTFMGEESQKKFDNLYKPQPRKKKDKEIFNDIKIDKLLKEAKFDYSKPYDYLASNLFNGNNNKLDSSEKNKK